MFANFSSHHTPVVDPSSNLASPSEITFALPSRGGSADDAAATEELQNAMAVLAHVEAEAAEAERRSPCPGCGASKEHQNDAYNRFEWLGLGETDCCNVCGAEYEHWALDCKTPLSDWPLKFLVEKAREVEWAYTDINRKMTSEQIVQNREYFKRIVLAIRSSKIYHIEDRAEQTEASVRWLQLIDEATELFAKVHDGGTARMFYKYCASGYTVGELIETIANLRRDLEQLDPANGARQAGWIG